MTWKLHACVVFLGRQGHAGCVVAARMWGLWGSSDKEKGKEDPNNESEVSGDRSSSKDFSNSMMKGLGGNYACVAGIRNTLPFGC